MSEWIKISEKLPGLDVYILVTSGSNVWIAVRDGDFWIGYDGVFRITHWMPLPLPPAE